MMKCHNGKEEEEGITTAGGGRNRERRTRGAGRRRALTVSRYKEMISVVNALLGRNSVCVCVWRISCVHMRARRKTRHPETQQPIGRPSLLIFRSLEVLQPTFHHLSQDYLALSQAPHFPRWSLLDRYVSRPSSCPAGCGIASASRRRAKDGGREVGMWEEEASRWAKMSTPLDGLQEKVYCSVTLR